MLNANASIYTFKLTYISDRRQKDVKTYYPITDYFFHLDEYRKCCLAVFFEDLLIQAR